VQDLEQEKSKVAATMAEIEQVRAEKEQINELGESKPTWAMIEALISIPLVAEHKKLPFTEVCVKLSEYVTKMNSYRGVIAKEQAIVSSLDAWSVIPTKSNPFQFDQLKADQLNSTFAEEEVRSCEVESSLETSTFRASNPKPSPT